MNQKLVTKKNRKVRRLRELYPDCKIKIFYQRDYVALLLANTILSGEGSGSLLFQNLRTRHGYVYSVDSSISVAVITGTPTRLDR